MDTLNGQAMSLPADLEALVKSQFDDLVGKGAIYYEESKAELVMYKGFQFEFRVVPILGSKPITPADDPGRSNPVGPFISPRPEEIVTSVGLSHRLLVNKYCMYRPMLVLPTIEYAPQTDDLDRSDLAAAWAVLNLFKTPQMVIYNCGFNASSSQGHKHLQIIPQPGPGGSALFPSYATSTETITSDIPNVSFKHFVLRLPKNMTVDGLVARYQRLLRKTKHTLAEINAGSDYNVIFTTSWIALIPRTNPGLYGASAVGMLGLVTLRNRQERELWHQSGYSDHLATIGIPRSLAQDDS